MVTELGKADNVHPFEQPVEVHVHDCCVIWLLLVIVVHALFEYTE